LFIYAGLSAMFFLVSFDLIDRRGLTPTDAGLVFLPFTLGVGLLSQPFGALADKIGARTMLIAGPLAASLALLLLALASNASLALGVIAPMALLGIAFAVLVTPLTSSVMSIVAPTDEALASGINNAVSRVAQLAGVALSAGVASYSSGYRAGLAAAAVLAAGGAATIAALLPPSAQKHRRQP
jgi:MFS family permease